MEKANKTNASMLLGNSMSMKGGVSFMDNKTVLSGSPGRGARTEKTGAFSDTMSVATGYTRVSKTGGSAFGGDAPPIEGDL